MATDKFSPIELILFLGKVIITGIPMLCAFIYFMVAEIFKTLIARK